jgi:hypothetical protein
MRTKASPEFSGFVTSYAALSKATLLSPAAATNVAAMIDFNLHISFSFTIHSQKLPTLPSPLTPQPPAPL